MLTGSAILGTVSRRESRLRASSRSARQVSQMINEIEHPRAVQLELIEHNRRLKALRKEMRRTYRIWKPPYGYLGAAKISPLCISLRAQRSCIGQVGVLPALNATPYGINTQRSESNTIK